MTIRRNPHGWRKVTVADICQMQNGHGFGPEDWDIQGLPIVRIQNIGASLRWVRISPPVRFQTVGKQLAGRALDAKSATREGAARVY